MLSALSALVAEPGVQLVIAMLLFFLDGAEAADGFLKHDLAAEILGGVAMVLALILGLTLRVRRSGT